MVTKETLLRNFKESMPAWRSESTKYRYPALIGHFIDHIGAKSTYDRTDAMKFLNYMVRSGRSANYARWSYHVLRQFYKSLGIEFPLSARELPPLPGSDEINAPVFSREYVEALIAAVKRKGTPAMKAYLALSTTFGFRRMELAKMSSSAIFNGVIEVQAVKGGELRKHLVPEEIAPYLAGFQFPQRHEQTMVNLFHRMQSLAGLPQNIGDGFHALRRSLVTELTQTGLPLATIYTFMGWKLSSRFGILGVYTRIDSKEVCRVVYRVHPFLNAWR